MATLESIPEDIKHLICAELDDRASIRTLWCLSRSWRQVAEPYVYRAFVWTVLPTEGPGDTARHLKDDPQGGKYLRHARYLEIVHGQPGSVALATNTEPFTLLETLCPSPPDPDEYYDDIKQDRQTAERFWKPLLEVIPQFYCLHDLILHLPDRFPPGLVAAMEGNHPLCRIHLRHFRFESLGEHLDECHEWALISSPNLHSMNAMVDDWRSRDFNDYAALHTIGLAPNLKHVRILAKPPRGATRIYSSLEDWQACLPPLPEPILPFNKVQTLALLGLADLFEWSEITERITSCALTFPQLRALRFNCSDYEDLEKLARNRPFPKLLKLDMRMRPSTLLFPSEEAIRERSNTFQSAVGGFVGSLNSLHTLSLSGCLEGLLLEPIVENHGSSLTTLNFESEGRTLRNLESPALLSVRDLNLLAKKCSNLVRLKLEVRRSLGDRLETAVYEALGSMSKLEHLHIRLHCYNPTLWRAKPDETWDEFDSTPAPLCAHAMKYYRNLKDVILNGAVDEHLARAIWDIINRRRGANGLKSLELEPINMRVYGPWRWIPEMDIILEHVRRHWQLIADTAVKGGVVFRDVTIPGVIVGTGNLEQVEQFRADKPGSEDGAGSIVFNHLWPHQEGAISRRAWRSWPLQR